MTEESPFSTLESTQEFVQLVEEAIRDTLADVEIDLRNAKQVNAERRIQALQLVTYRLEKLSFHMSRSRRLLNDLVMLRRILFDERSVLHAASADANGSESPKSITVGT